MKRLTFVTVILVLALAACRPATPGPATPTPTASPLPRPTESPISPLPEPDPIAAAVRLVADTLDVDPAAIGIVSTQAVDWPDASLGCPQPDTLYAQVVTPGYLALLEVNGQTYRVHTDASGQTVVLCDRAPEGRHIDAAIHYVASQLGIAPQDVTVVSVRDVEWPSSALGCPRPGMMYLDVIVPGYQIVLQAEGRRLNVHTNRDGEQIVICDRVSHDPANPQSAFRTVLSYLETNHAGFGLAQRGEWSEENRTPAGLVGASTRAWVSGQWVVELVYPVIPEPTYQVTLSNLRAGVVWSGTVEPDGSVVPEDVLSVLATVGACDAALEGEALAAWAGVDVSVENGTLRVEHRAAYVCCAEFAVSVGRDGDELKVVETNVGEICRCLCGYPISIEVSGLAAGMYTVEVWGIQHHDIPVDLLGSAEVTLP